MFVPSSYGASIVVALFSMCCWGSWSNTLKATEGLVCFEAFYMDFSLSAVIFAVIVGLTLGMARSSGLHGEATFADDLHGKPLGRYAYALAAGVVFNLANLCLCKGIGMLGLALAFPICIGTALVLGTLLTYAVQPQGNLVVLVLGVCLAFIAVCQAAAVQHIRDRQRPPEDKGPGAAILASDGLVEEAAAPRAAAVPFARKLTVCVVGGVLMSLWNPLVTLAEKDGGLSSYGEQAVYSLGLLLSSLGLLPMLLVWPLEGGPPKSLRVMTRHYCALPMRLHAVAFAGGCIWLLGTLANAIAGSSGLLSPAESYAIGQCANMVAILWGALYFREFRGTSLAVRGLLASICCFYLGAILCIAAAR